MLSLEVLLPHNEEYTPPLSIRVVDNRKFGRRPVIGVHTITSLKTFARDPPRPEALWRAELEERKKQHRARIALETAHIVIQVEGTPPFVIYCVACDFDAYSLVDF